MLNWIKCSDRMPDNQNTIRNWCLIRTIYDQYMFANWSVHLHMWRRISIPVLDKSEIIDELIEPENVYAWVLFEDIKMDEQIFL